MTLKVELGAPSLTGKDANDLVKEAFGESTFPLAVIVTNHMPRQVVFPVVGVFLGHVCDEKNAAGTVTINTYDQLQSFATDVEQIAELNRYELALTIEEVEKPKKSKSSEKAATSGGQAATGDATKESGAAGTSGGSEKLPAE